MQVGNDTALKFYEKYGFRRTGGNGRPPIPRDIINAGNNPDITQSEHRAGPDAAALSRDDKQRSRPGTARASQQAPSSGMMPPTPGASEGEYYLITQADLDDGPR